MNPELWQRVDEIFQAACGLPADQRTALLDQQCGDDWQLRAEVESLLAHHDDPTTPLRRFERETEQLSPRSDPRVGTRLGPFHIKRLIARGGMGSVYEAVQQKPRRSVALKLMNHGIASRSALRRFEFEAQLLARLRHPGIAQVYEAGTHDDGAGGVPYFAMEYMPNAMPITEYADARKLNTRQRLELFIKVCEAVHHGHQKGIIHRDLKPNNILVDSSGHPKIIDFGVARSTDSDMAFTTLQTSVGELIGTLQYMSPEQCAADPHDLDTRSDVYTLGVIAYELLAARMPYQVSRAQVYEATRVIREQPPERLSTIDRRLRGDLETIVLKALEKERERRYQSAAEFAEDLRRYLNHESIQARPPSMAYQFRTFARRNKATVSGVLAVMAALVAGTCVATFFAVQASHQSRVAQTNAQQAVEHAQQMRREKQRADRQTLAAELQTKLAIQRLQRLERTNYNFTLNRVQAIWQNNPGQALALLKDPERCPAHLRDFTWELLHSRPTRFRHTLRGHTDAVISVAYSPDGTTMASGGQDNTVRVWDATTGRMLRSFQGHTDEVRCVRFSPDGKKLASASGDATLKLWDPQTGHELATLRGHATYARSLDFSPDGRTLASAASDKTVKLWDVPSAKVRATLLGHEDQVQAVTFSPDGATLASGSYDDSIKLWDASTGEQRGELIGHTGGVWALAFSPNGQTLASGSQGGEDRSIKLWNMTTGETLLTLKGHSRGVTSVAFAPDSEVLASCSMDGTIMLWDIDTGKELFTLKGHLDKVECVAFSSDGKTLASASFDKTIKLWDLDINEAPEQATLEGHTDAVTCIAYSPDGSTLASASADQTIKLWDATTGVERCTLTGHSGRVWSLAFAPNGKTLASASADRTIQLWAVMSGEKLTTHHVEADPGGSTGPRSSLAFSPDGAVLACAGGWNHELIHLWNLNPSSERAILVGPNSGVHSLAFTPDGRTLIGAGGYDAKAIVLWDMESLQERARLPGHTNGIWAVALSADGQTIASGGMDRTIRLWNAATGELRATLRGHSDEVLSVAFSPNGKTLASASSDETIKLWDVVNGQERAMLQGHTDTVYHVAFSPDGNTLASASADHTIKLWQTVARGAQGE